MKKRIQIGLFLIKWSSFYNKWQVWKNKICLEEFKNIDDAISFSKRNK